MARASKSKWAILGILTIEPSSGYDIKKFTEEMLRHFWHESYGNLYTKLKQLLEKKLVTNKIYRQSGKPDRIVYSITEAGRQEFKTWIQEPAAPDIVRSELLLKMFFGNHLAPKKIISVLEDYRGKQEKNLRILHGIGMMLSEMEDQPGLTCWKLTLRRGILVGEARIKWVDECLQTLENKNC